MKTSVTKVCEVLVIGAYLSIGACGLFFPGAGVVLGPPNIAAEDPENITPTTSYTRARVSDLRKVEEQMLLAGAVEGAEQPPPGESGPLASPDPMASSTYCEFSYDKKPFFCGLGYGADSLPAQDDDVSTALTLSKDGRVVGGWIKENCTDTQPTYAKPYLWVPHGADPAAKALTPPSAPPPSAFEPDIPSSEKIKTLHHSFVFGLSPNGLRATGSISYRNDPSGKPQKQAFYWDYTEGISAGLSSLANDTSPANFTLKRQSDFDLLTPTTTLCSYDSAGFAIADTDLEDYRMLGGFATTNERTAGYSDCAKITFDPLNPDEVQFRLGALPFSGIVKSTTQLSLGPLPAGYSYAEIIGLPKNSDRKIIGNALVEGSLRYRGYFWSPGNDPVLHPEGIITLLPKNTGGNPPSDPFDPDFTRANAVTDNAEAIAGTLFSSNNHKAALWEWNGSSYSIKTLGIPGVGSSTFWPSKPAEETFALGVAKLDGATRIVGKMEFEPPLPGLKHPCNKVGTTTEYPLQPTEAFIWDSRWVQNNDPVTGIKNLKTYLQEYLKQNNGFNSGLDAWTLCDATISSDGKTISGRGVLNEMFSSDPNYCRNTYNEDPTNQAKLAKCRHQAFIAHIPGLTGNGDLTVSAPVTAAPPETISAIIHPVTGDFNNDGNIDIVAGNSLLLQSKPPQELDILYGRGDGTFEERVVFPGLPFMLGQVLSGDFDRDGNLDLLAYSGGSSGVSSLTILKGTGVKTPAPFTVAATYDGGGKRSVVGDFTKDGILDIARAGLPLLVGNGDCTFSSAASGMESFPGQLITAADLDGDGNTDLVGDLPAAEYPGDPEGEYRIAVLKGTGANPPYFAPYIEIPTTTRASSLTTGDFNGDGLQDIAVNGRIVLNPRPAGFKTNVIELLLGDGTVFQPSRSGFRSPHPKMATNANIDDKGTYDIIAADINGDGHPDLAAIQGYSYFTFPVIVMVHEWTLSVLLSQKDGPEWILAPAVSYTFEPFASPPFAARLAAGDFNKDGKMDLVTGRKNYLNLLQGN